ncbi:alpha/beta fold hydrolase [Pseudonocardia humida]|uniref:Alpha/beta fold hydrolase n=1 Tax=Pseudonocardia humida TaxID=2800819 RepID=A0ABT1A0K7_9PSEU|nr:alpha/beta fold hydrolase [Pseudonocardia humida]MCO1656496.1 alpha/beta fold hydrolase [Pseudonocardia humida]
MPAVFVHGNPETAAVWGPLLAELGREDVVRLSPPGFGAPLPAGFGATVTDYRDWLVDELAAIGEPVDLVGHDWGGGHVVAAVAARPELVRSWVSDAVGLFDPDYEWHALAQVWQRPGEGEAAVEADLGTRAARSGRLVERGFPADLAAEIAAGQGPELGRAILTLYRSAVQPVMAELGRDLGGAARRPGLAVLAGQDVVGGSDEQRRRTAARAGARVAELPGLGHWWMVQDPAAGARTLTDFWSTLPAAR